MEIPEVKQTEQVQRIKHVQLGDVIYAVDDILRVNLHKLGNPEMYKGNIHLWGLNSQRFNYERVTATVEQYKIMQEVLCGAAT